MVATVFGLTIVGYPIAGLAAILFDVPSKMTSVPFRLVVLALSFVVIARSIMAWRANLLQISLLGFLLAYLVRLSIDSSLPEPMGADSALLFFVVTVFVPVFALTVSTQYWSARRAASVVLFMGALATTVALLFYAFDYGGNRNLSQTTGRLSFETVNAITLGHTAVSTLIAAFSRMVFPKVLRLSCGFVVIGCGALELVILSGSKGPVMALVLVIVFCLLVLRRSKERRILILMLMGLLGFLSMQHIVDRALKAVMEIGQQHISSDVREKDTKKGQVPPQTSVTSTSEHQDVALRFVNVDKDWSTRERIHLWSATLKQIRKDPWFGSSYVEQQSKTYPHNLLLETWMALGIFALSLVGMLFFYGIQYACNGISVGSPFNPMIFVQFMIFAMFSGAIFGEAQLWLALAVLIAQPAAPFRPGGSSILERLHWHT